jgi:hypothetical protein
VREEAAHSFDLAREALRKPLDVLSQEIAIEVRDEAGPVMHLKFTFEINTHN